MSSQFPISPEDWAHTPPVVRALVIKLWRERKSAQKDPDPPSEEVPDEETPPPEPRRTIWMERVPAPRAPAAPRRAEPEVPPSPPADPPKTPVDEQAVEALYRRAYGFVEEVVLAVRAGQPFSVEVAFAIVSRIVGLEGAMDLFYKRAIYARESSGEGPGFHEAVITHSVNVGIYVLRVGEGLGLKSHRRLKSPVSRTSPCRSTSTVEMKAEM
jgi:hypothetical protein